MKPALGGMVAGGDNAQVFVPAVEVVLWEQSETATGKIHLFPPTPSPTDKCAALQARILFQQIDLQKKKREKRLEIKKRGARKPCQIYHIYIKLEN